MTGTIVAVTPLHSEAFSRGARMLRTALGPAITGFLEDPSIVEVMLNPDGRLWIDRLSGGLEDSGRTMSAADGERIVRLVAHHVGAEVHADKPRVSAELPETGERFEGLLPPVVAAPAFAIRKPAVAVFTLDDYVAAGIMLAGQAAALRAAVADRKNILVAGGTSTGKTTLTNALLAEIAGTTDRVVLIEDTRELQCRAPNLVALRTKDGVASLSDLVRSSLRLRPDRIPIGEVRGAEALDLLKAWGTGHPGGIGTIHAGTALGAMRRLEQLIQEAVVTVPKALIAETIDLVAVLRGRGSERRLSELALVAGLDPATGDYRVQSAGAGGGPFAPRRPIMNRVLAVAHSSRRRMAELITLATLTLAFAPAAYASGSSMPWETPLNSILESVQGPVAKIISVIIITVTGLTLAFGDTSGGFRRLIQIVFGLSIAFAASSFFLSFFSFSGGALV
jgi:P-type conjugative transfer ATPase TrbB